MGIIVAPARHSSIFSDLDERRGSKSTESSYRFFSSAVHSDKPLPPTRQAGEVIGWMSAINKGKNSPGDGATEDLSGSSRNDDSPPLPMKDYLLSRNSGSFRREPRDEAANIRRISLHSTHSSSSFRSAAPSPAPKRKSSSLYSNPLAPLQRRLLRSLEHRERAVKSERAEQVHEILIEILDAVTSFLQFFESSGESAVGWVVELRLLVEELIEINIEWKKAFDSGLYGPLSFVTSNKRLEENDLLDTGYEWWPRRLRRDCRCVLSWNRDDAISASSPPSKTESTASLLGSNSSEEGSTTNSKKEDQGLEERRIELLLIGQQRWARFRAGKNLSDFGCTF